MVTAERRTAVFRVALVADAAGVAAYALVLPLLPRPGAVSRR